jgi:hypothetical protein
VAPWQNGFRHTTSAPDRNDARVDDHGQTPSLGGVFSESRPTQWGLMILILVDESEITQVILLQMFAAIISVAAIPENRTFIRSGPSRQGECALFKHVWKMLFTPHASVMAKV